MSWRTYLSRAIGSYLFAGLFATGTTLMLGWSLRFAGSEH